MGHLPGRVFPGFGPPEILKGSDFLAGNATGIDSLEVAGLVGPVEGHAVGANPALDRDTERREFSISRIEAKRFGLLFHGKSGFPKRGGDSRAEPRDELVHRALGKAEGLEPYDGIEEDLSRAVVRPLSPARHGLHRDRFLRAPLCRPQAARIVREAALSESGGGLGDKQKPLARSAREFFDELVLQGFEAREANVSFDEKIPAHVATYAKEANAGQGETDGREYRRRGRGSGKKRGAAGSSKSKIPTEEWVPEFETAGG